MEILCTKCKKKFEADLGENLEIIISSKDDYDCISQFAVCPYCGEKIFIGVEEVESNTYFKEV